MLKVLRYYAKYTAQVSAVYAGFAAVILALSFMAGDLYGTAGVYASMLPTFGLIFGTIWGTSIDLYFNVALSMGARRGHCFWAAEFSTAVCSLLAAPTALLVYRCIQRLPGFEERVNQYTLAGWGVILLGTLVVQQLSLMAGRIANPKKKAAAMALMLVVAMTLVVIATLFGVGDPLHWGVLGAAARYIHLILAAAAVVLGAVAYKLYQKAVVTV